ncbi:MMPL family transporter [Nocardia sp. NPDC051463]|uniref:MMPL family transporter n=1 Tax=Nocardia sp. NPDC051463 TaxID=3154845 RepID=UPI00344C8377
MGTWDRYAAVVTGRRSWALLLASVVAGLALIGLIGGNDTAGQAPDSLPSSVESARVEQLTEALPDGRTASVILVATRNDAGELDAADLAATEAALMRMRGGAVDPSRSDRGLVLASDRRAALGQVPVPSDLTGFDLTDRIIELRAAAKTGAPEDVRLQVTGGPAFGADIADSFSGANVALLAVTAAVVAVLLIATYRSPVLWLVPLVVVGMADQIAARVGTAIAELTGLTFDGSTAGITSVLVFGAGTNYALLLVSRYRDELHREADHRVALSSAVRRAGPAILASNLTVVIALLTLLLATLPNTRSLGALAAAGLLMTVVFVLVALPPALALCGRNIFWPLTPRVDGRDAASTGVWHRIAEGVVRRPVLVSGSVLLILTACACALFTTQIGLSQAEQFRVRAESVDGLDTLAAHFPSGAASPATVLARTEAAGAASAVLEATPGVSTSMTTGPMGTGYTRWSVTLDASPGSADAFDAIAGIRTQLAEIPGADALVGGSDAQALDVRDSARRDQMLVIPMILAVALIVLVVLLRAIPAGLLLVGVTVLSALAALGLGSWISGHVFGFPALDTNVPLFGFLFLTALGIDYTIFLVARAREETAGHGTTRGIVRAVSSTGAVITSAGIVLAAVFCVLGVLPLITLTQLGIVVGLGILLDTFVVRTLAIPALFSLVGDRVWWPSRPVPNGD